MAFTEVGSEAVRGTYYDRVLKGFADRAYKFKQAVTISSTGAWTNIFYRGSTTILSGQSGNATKGIPRGASFPNANTSWEKVTSYIEKYGLEANIPWEDIISNEIDVMDRTLMKISEGVAKAVDDQIYAVLTESGTPVNIQNVVVTGRGWDVASGTIIDDLLQCKQKILEYNYPVEELMLFVSPKDHRGIINYLASKGAQFPSIGERAASNGNAGTLAGIKIIVSNSVTASQALVVVPQRCGNWKELVALQTEVVEDKFKSKTIRAVEMGVCQLTDPKAVVLITGTQNA